VDDAALVHGVERLEQLGGAAERDLDVERTGATSL